MADGGGTAEGVAVRVSSVKDLKKALEKAHKETSRTHLESLAKNKSVERTPTALAVAAGDGDLDLVRELLADGVDCNGEVEFGGAALTFAAYKGQVETASALLEGGADPSVETKSGRTALMVAADRGFVPLVELLAKVEKDINHADKDGRTALMLAAAADHGDVCKSLVAAGANMELKAPDTGDTALWIAARLGKPDAVKALCDLGADFGKHEDGGSMAFDAARQCTDPDPAVGEKVYDILLDADLDREEAEEDA